MKRRKFLALSLVSTGAFGVLRSWAADGKKAADKGASGGAKITAKDILKEGQPAAVANYCEHPSKQPNKFCPTKPGGTCSECMFYNKDNSKTTFEKQEVAKCQLLATAPSYVYSTAACSTFVKKT